MNIFRDFIDDKKTVTLEVASSLTYVDIVAVEPLWKTMMAAGLRGYYRFCVKKKVQGKRGKADLIKVIGLSEMFDMVRVITQANSDSCYDGLLSGYATDPEALKGSKLKEALRTVAGDGWFNPATPSVREVHPEVTPPVPLVSVEPPLQAALTPPEPPKKEKGKGIGLTKDKEQMKLLFEEFWKVSAFGDIASTTISKVIIDFVHGANPPAGANKTGAAMMAAWCRRGLLERMYKRNNVTYYRITEAAMKAFDLKMSKSTLLSPEKASQDDEVTPPVVPGTLEASSDQGLPVISTPTDEEGNFQVAGDPAALGITLSEQVEFADNSATIRGAVTKDSIAALMDLADLDHIAMCRILSRITEVKNAKKRLVELSAESEALFVEIAKLDEFLKQPLSVATVAFLEGLKSKTYSL